MSASSHNSESVPGITDEDFLKFKEFFYRKTGINFEPSKRYFVDKRLVERIKATGTENFRGYFTLLRFQPSGEELQQLTNLMTVNETYFLREEYQFKCLVDSILPEIVERKRNLDPIRIWCIPSSSGEEPYSIAMYLRKPGRGSQTGTWRSSLRTSIPTFCGARGPGAIPSAPCSICRRFGWRSISRA
jgi:chemotaxis methyl-accepting protein methylase